MWIVYDTLIAEAKYLFAIVGISSCTFGPDESVRGPGVSVLIPGYSAIDMTTSTSMVQLLKKATDTPGNYIGASMTQASGVSNDTYSHLFP